MWNSLVSTSWTLERTVLQRKIHPLLLNKYKVQEYTSHIYLLISRNPKILPYHKKVLVGQLNCTMCSVVLYLPNYLHADFPVPSLGVRITVVHIVHVGLRPCPHPLHLNHMQTLIGELLTYQTYLCLHLGGCTLLDRHPRRLRL